MSDFKDTQEKQRIGREWIRNVVEPQLRKARTERKGQGLVRLMLDADEVVKLTWMAKTLNKTQDETVEMIVRAHLVGIKYEDYDE
mgnify:FL=1